MRIRASSRIWESSQARGTPLLVLLSIADHADDHGYAWPTVNRLAQKARVHERTVQRAVDSVVGLGCELQVWEQPGKQRVYRVIVGLASAEVSDSLPEDVQRRAWGIPHRQFAAGATAMSPEQSVGVSVSHSLFDKDGSEVPAEEEESGEEVTFNGRELHVTSTLLQRWQRMFPLVDVPATLRFIEEYSRTRPSWARRRRSWRRTVLNWLKRDQERLQGKQLPRPARRETPLPDRAAEIAANIRVLRAGGAPT